MVSAGNQEGMSRWPSGEHFRKVGVNFSNAFEKLRKLRTKICLPELANGGHQ